MLYVLIRMKKCGRSNFIFQGHFLCVLGESDESWRRGKECLVVFCRNPDPQASNRGTEKDQGGIGRGERTIGAKEGKLSPSLFQSGKSEAVEIKT